MSESSVAQAIFPYVPQMLAAIAGALSVFALFNIVTRKRTYIESNDEWRDPPPVFQKIFKPFLKMLAPEVRKFLNDKTYQRMSQRLSAGGMNYAILPEEFVTLRFLFAVTGGVGAFFLLRANTDGSMLMTLLALALPPGAYAWPDMWLRDQILRRRKEASREFPFLLDLLVLSMRAGLNYSGALSHAIGAMPPGPIREEFGKLLREIRAGKARRDALLDLAKRMDSEAINNFVAAINQAEETGGEIVDVLIAQASQKRAERFNMAEAAANRAPVRMLLPMMGFLFPIIFMLMGFVIVVKMGEVGYLSDGMLSLLRQ